MAAGLSGPAPKNQRPFDLVVFDLDGTLVDHHEPIWKTLHTRLGSNPARRRQIVRDGLAGRISYADWVAADVAMLQAAGADRRGIHAIIDRISPLPGAVELLVDLGLAGIKRAILSGAIACLAERRLPMAQIDMMHINRLRYSATGALVAGEATPYDLATKANGVIALAASVGTTLDRVAFVGNGTNDLHAAQTAGFAIAWADAPPELIGASDVYVPGPDLSALRRYLGLP